MTELEAPPRVPGMLILAACDRQQASLERHEPIPGGRCCGCSSPSGPTRAATGTGVGRGPAGPAADRPRSRRAAPAHPAGRRRQGAGRRRVHPAGPAGQAGRAHRRLGDRLGAEHHAVGRGRAPAPGRDITALGAGAQYRASGVLAKAHRLRRQGEALHAKLDHCQRLTADDEAHPLTAKAAVLRRRPRRVAGRRPHLNDALAWSAARWAADQAIAAGATVIYVEDLRSMEARGMGRTLNTRLSQTVRGQITGRLRHIAAEHGIAVVTVPARGTSRNCPRCLAPLRHCKAPDQPTVPGWKWARCPGCGWQGDRDTRRLAADRRPRPHPPGAHRRRAGTTAP